ncbi:dihydrolipoamide acetyltransferase family protein [Nitratifractor sp.]
MAYNIVMPQLSDSMEEGKLISWKVNPGDRVKTGDVIAEVESDKAIMEVQTFHDGIVKELKVKEGESVPVGTVIAVIDEAGASSSAKSAVSSRQSVKEESKGNGEVESVNEKPAANEKVQEVKKADDRRLTTDDSHSILDEILGVTESQHSELNTQHASEATGIASPKARALAAKLGLDIEALQKEGKLPTPAHERDIKKYYYRRYFTTKALKLLQEYNLSPELFPVGKKHSEKEILEYIAEHEIPKVEPLDPMRKAIIATVTQAQQKPVYHIYDAIDAALLKAHESDRFTVTVWLLKLFGEAMMRHEDFRKTLSDNGFQLWPNASISLAMAHGEALYMPVFRDLNRKTADRIADELAAMKEKVKTGRVTPEDMKGSTFGISNLGMTGVTRFDAMINAQDCGIAAIGSEVEGKISVTLTLDHRIVNGWQGAQFMQTLKELAQDKAFFKV